MFELVALYLSRYQGCAFRFPMDIGVISEVGRRLFDEEIVLALVVIRLAVSLTDLIRHIRESEKSMYLLLKLLEIFLLHTKFEKKLEQPSDS